MSPLSLTVDQWLEDRPMPRDELLRRVHGVDALLCLITDRVDAELLDAAGTPTGAKC